MTLCLRVDRAAWRSHVERVARSFAEVVPVVKGNGYGFGRAALAELAMELIGHRADQPRMLAVGTLHEVADVPGGVRPVVLTPPAPGPDVRPPAELLAAAERPIVTVGSPAHVEALVGGNGGWRGEVLVKLQSSMRRFGVGTGSLAAFEDLVGDAGLTIEGHSIHLPLAGGDEPRLAEIERWVEQLESRSTVRLDRRSLWVSHLGPDAYAVLRDRWPRWRFPLRTGTALWHGDKSALHLGATVVDVRPVTAGSEAGYHRTTVASDGSLVIVGAGTAHGITTLDDGRSPFHHRHRRLALLERPHMHTSTVFVPTGDPCPAVGEIVDVQRPLTSVTVDEVIWR